MTQLQEQETPREDLAAPMLTFEAACALLKGQGRLISPDDLELVVLVSLHNEFMRLQFEESEALLKRHDEAMTKIMGTAVKNMKCAMEEERTAFSSAVRVAALENVTALISQHQKDMAEHGMLVRGCTTLALAGIGILGAVFVLLGIWGKLL